MIFQVDWWPFPTRFMIVKSGKRRQIFWVRRYPMNGFSRFYSNCENANKSRGKQEWVLELVPGNGAFRNYPFNARIGWEELQAAGSTTLPALPQDLSHPCWKWILPNGWIVRTPVVLRHILMIGERIFSVYPWSLPCSDSWDWMYKTPQDWLISSLERTWSLVPNSNLPVLERSNGNFFSFCRYSNLHLFSHADR